MPRINRSPQADDDIFEIAAWISKDKPVAALDWIDRIDEAVTRLAEFPGIGTRRDELAPALRSWPVGNYLIFYREIPDGIELVRVMHGARNLRSIFKVP